MQQAPWWRTNVFRPKPSGGQAYGVIYLKDRDWENRSPGEARKEEHVIQFDDYEPFCVFIEEQLSDVTAVWRPERPDMHPVFELPEFQEEIALADKQRLESSLQSARFWTLLAGIAIIFGVLYSDKITMRGSLLIFIFYGIAWAFEKGPSQWIACAAALHRIKESVSAYCLAIISAMRFQAWLQLRSNIYTKIFCVLMALLFIAQIQIGLEKSIELAALEKTRLIEQGEWWRLLSVGYLHGSIIHVGFNVLLLFMLGTMIERLFGAWRMLSVFWLSVVAGALASTWYSDVTSVGASGGVLGLGGIVIVQGICNPALRQVDMAGPIMRWILLMIVIGFIGAGFIDNAAHAGGLIGGIFFGYVLVPKDIFQTEHQFRSSALGDKLLMALSACGALAILKEFYPYL